jgi:hypothetical protein
MLVRVLFDNNGDKVSFLTADRVCTVGRVLRDNAGGEEEVDEAVEIAETLVVEEVVEGVDIVE